MLLLERRVAAVENRYRAVVELFRKSMSILEEWDEEPIRIPERPWILKELGIGRDPVDPYALPSSVLEVSDE